MGLYLSNGALYRNCYELHMFVYGLDTPFSFDRLFKYKRILAFSLSLLLAWGSPQVTKNYLCYIFAVKWTMCSLFSKKPPTHSHPTFHVPGSFSINPNGIERGRGKNRPCDSKFSKKCPCSHNNNTTQNKYPCLILS